MKPPHLPPQSCSVPAYYVRQSLPWIFVVVIIAMLSGIAGALATAAWVLPSLQSSNTTGTIRGGTKQSSLIAPDALVAKTVSQRILTIYDRTKRRSGVAYTPDAVIGQAVVLSSDGWAVLSLPSYTPGAEQQWEIVDFQGIAYEPSQVITDPVMGLAYIRIDARGLPIISFRQQERFNEGELLWAHSYAQWDQAQVGDRIRVQSLPWRIWQPAIRRRVNQHIPIGSILINANGQLAGFVDAQQAIIGVDAIQRQLSSLLQEGELIYTVVPWEGYMVDGFFINDVYVRRPGFLVTSGSSGKVKIGDIILEIHGQTAQPESVSRLIIDAPNEFAVLVLRDGEEVVINVMKEMLDIRH